MTPTDFTSAAFRGIISTVKTDERSAFLLPGLCEIQALTLQCLLSPGRRQALAPSVLTPEGPSGAFVFNHINPAQIKITCDQQVISGPSKPHSGGVIYV